MEFIYELRIIYEDGTKTNLLFKTREGAQKELIENCQIGQLRTNGVVSHSFVLARMLFD